MRRAMLALALLLVAGCGDDAAPGPGRDKPSHGIQFLTVDNVDGTHYRCLYRYDSRGEGGGPAMWCERLPR